MTDYLNRVCQVITTTGTGSSIVLALTSYGDSFFTMAEAGAIDGHLYDYVISDGNDVEIHESETWTAAAREFSRGTPKLSRIGGAAGTSKISLSGSAILRIFQSAESMKETEAKANSAVQPDDLGSAAFESASSFATVEQGETADSAIQSIVEGNGVTVDNTDARNPIVTVSMPAPTVQTFLSGSGTYTTPAGVTWIEVELVGGGSSGAGGNAANWNSGTATCWNTSGPACTSPLVSAGGGNNSTGGSVSGSLTPYFAVNGQSGHAGTVSLSGQMQGTGGMGGSSHLGGGGTAVYASAGGNAVTNSGSGGSGGGVGPASTVVAGQGGGAGAYARFIIANPASSYTYAVGTGGAAAAAGSNGLASGAGAAGRITIIEHYGS